MTHISVLAHITMEELHHELLHTDIANGFANRFRMVRARPQRLHREGCSMTSWSPSWA